MEKDLAKIVLVNPVTRNKGKVLRAERCQQRVLSFVGLWPPVTLLEVATYLRNKGFKNIEIIDGEIEGLLFDELIAEIVSKAPAMVIMQITTPTINDDIIFSTMIKQKLTNTVRVFIGLHATVFPEELLKSNSAEYVVLGEPEEVIAALADNCFKAQGDINQIKGLGYKKDNNIFINKTELTKENYDYPVIPDRSLLRNEKYIMPLTGKPFAIIKVSRGCDYACSFCTSRIYYGRGWKGRSPENIITEIKEVKERHKIDTFLFLADTFNGNEDFVAKLCSMIIKEKLDIKWVANSRVDLVDDYTVGLMRKAGCMLVSLGIESYDENILRENRKCLDKVSIDRGIEIFKKHGIITYGYYIFGLEGESITSILKTVLRASCSQLDFAIFYSLTPYPGTDYFYRYNCLKWENYFHGISNIVEYKHLSKEMIKLCIHLALITFYIRPRRLFLLIRYILKGKLC